MDRDPKAPVPCIIFGPGTPVVAQKIVKHINVEQMYQIIK
jgi:hypothetical protein